MRWIIEARLDDGVREASHKGGEVLAVFERRDRCLSQLGLTLAEGRSLLAKVQSELLSQQVAAWLPSAKRDRLPLLRFDLASQRQSFHRAAHRVRQGEGHEPTAVVLCLPKGAAPLHASIGQGAAQTRHAGVGIYAGQVGRPPAVQGSHGFAEGGAAGWTRRSRSAAPGTNKLPMPVLAIGGVKSVGANEAVVMRNAATNVTELVILNSGHWLMEEQPDATISVVREFLNRQP